MLANVNLPTGGCRPKGRQKSRRVVPLVRVWAALAVACPTQKWVKSDKESRVTAVERLSDLADARFDRAGLALEEEHLPKRIRSKKVV